MSCESPINSVLPVGADNFPTTHPIEFRPILNGVVPYIAYPLNMPTQEGPVPCNGLILGPGSHQSAEVAVNMFLETQHIRVHAQPSKVPYRPAYR